MIWNVLKLKFPKHVKCCTLLSTIIWNTSRWFSTLEMGYWIRVFFWPARWSQKNIQLNNQTLSLPLPQSHCIALLLLGITIYYLHRHALLLAAPPEHICHHRSTFIPSLMEKLAPICKKDRKGKCGLPGQQRGYFQTLMEINVMCQAALSSGKLEK